MLRCPASARPRDADSRWYSDALGAVVDLDGRARAGAGRGRRPRGELRKAGSNPPACSNAPRRTSMQAAVTAWNCARPVHGRVIGRESPRRCGAGRPSWQIDDAGMLHDAVREQQLAPTTAAAGMRVGVRDQRVQPAGLRLVSLLRNTSSSPRAAAAPSLHAAAKPPFSLASQRRAPRPAGRRAARASSSVDASSTTTISNGVARRVGQDRVEAAAREPRPAVHRDHDRAAQVASRPAPVEREDDADVLVAHDARRSGCSRCSLQTLVVLEPPHAGCGEAR